MLLDHKNIVIPCRGTARLDDVRGVTLRVVCGSVWITQSDSREDVSLDAGESFCITRSGPTLVAACHDAPLSEIALERPIAVALTLRERLRRILLPVGATPSNPLEVVTSSSPDLQSRRRRLILGFVAAVALPAIALGLFAASDASFALSGDVELLVFHEDKGLSAVVDAQRLKVSASTGSSQIGRPFAASMLLVYKPEEPAPSTAD